MNQIDFFKIFILFLIFLFFIWLGYMADSVSNASVNKDNNDCLFLKLIYGATVGIFLTISYFADEPKAIDVYRNKTELKLTYDIIGNDTLDIDSVVVFKK